MLKAQHKPLKVIQNSNLMVDSPLWVINSEDHLQKNAIENVKHGSWDVQSALFISEHNQKEALNRLHSLEAAFKLINGCKSLDDCLDIVSRVRLNTTELIQNHIQLNQDSESTLVGLNAVNEYLENAHGELKTFKTVPDAQSYIGEILKHAVNYLHSVEHNNLFSLSKSLEKRIKTAKTVIERNQLAKLQYIHLKHSDQESFTSLELGHWEIIGHFETSSGRLAIIPNKQFKMLNSEYLQKTLSKMVNPSSYSDTHINAVLASACSYAISLITPQYNLNMPILGIINDQGDIMEILIHFDL